MTPQEFQELLDRYTRGQCTPQEVDFITEWYDGIGQQEVNEVREEYRVVIEAKIWHRLRKEMSGFPWLRVAASLVLVASVGAALLLHSDSSLLAVNQQAHSSATDKLVSMVNSSPLPQHINLNDGSMAILQPNSELRFPSVFGSQREVYLKGEAFFTVAHDSLHPFLVYSNEVVTKVLGTSFTIKAYDAAEKITVSVRTGRVSVFKSEKMKGKSAVEELILTPNEEAIYDRTLNTVSRQLASKPKIIQEVHGPLQMEYEDAKVVEIFEDLETLYGIRIEFDEQLLEYCTITTSLQEEGLFERISVICEAIGATYEIQETAIRIDSNGCKE